MDHYSAIKDHLQDALEAAITQEDLLLVANISHPLDLVSDLMLTRRAVYLEGRANQKH